jgi:hypothetical protein
VAATRLDQPALRFPPDEPGTSLPVDGGDRGCMVLFRDGSWRLCRAASWQRDGDCWRVFLRWGVGGQPLGSWYVYDPERVRASVPP